MNNLNVFADATIDGGSYDSIRVFGSAHVTGNLEAKTMNVFGSSDFTGSCKIELLNVFGSCDFKAIVEVDKMDIKGSCEFNEDVKVNNLKIFGSVLFNKNVFKADEISIFGDVKVKVLEANLIVVKGVVTCSEQLNAEKIEISTSSGSKIKEMVGSIIEVKPEHNIIPHSHRPVVVEVIEGDDIYLENVIANVVRGKKVKIGPNCQIETIEYSDSIEVSNKSKVKAQEKI